MADRVRATKRTLFRGMKTNVPADALADGKYGYAQNVNAFGDVVIGTRAGYAIIADSGSSGPGFSTSSSRITDIGSYATLGTDSKPRIVVHDSSGGVWLDDGVKKGTVGSGGVSASLIPFRPNQSPQSWLYVCNATGFKKFQAPDASNNVTVQKVGIAEPQAPPDACPDGFQFNDFTSTHTSWTQGGTAGAPSDVTRSTDTVVAIFQDPASVSPVTKTRYSVQVGTSVVYQIGETLKFNKNGGGTVLAVVEDVFPPISSLNITIQSIYYFNGVNGNCIIVPSQLPVSGLVAQTDNTQAASSALPPLVPQLAGLRRGSLIRLNNGGGTAETVFVLNVTVGPQMQIAIECSTTNTHAAGEGIIGEPAIGVSGISALVVGQTVTSAQINSTVTKGIGTLSQTLGSNPFNLALGTVGVPQEDDLVHVSFTLDVPTNLTELKIIFDIGDGSFTQNVLYYPVEASILQQAVSNASTQSNVAGQLANPQVIYQALINSGYTSFQATIALQQLSAGTAKLIYDPGSGSATFQNSLGQQTQLNTPLTTGVGQYTEVVVSIRSLTRVGNDQTKTLANCNAVQILANVTASTVLGFGSIWVGGGGQPDCGQNGAPYYYRVVPRSSLTGAPGNPSPSTRYGVTPRLQSVIVSLPSAAYDAQIDTWDIYRLGGSVNSWRYIGSAKSTAATYTDNALDSAALGGSALQFDNFEPWPSVDVPWLATSGSNVTSITVTGTAVIVMAVGSAFLSTTLRWLPGTLITLDGQFTYTLWNRPVAIAGGVLFRILQNASAPSVSTLFVGEPIVANQNMPYAWGPDANGIVFCAGDPLKPGTFYSSKPNSPDTTPNNPYDLTPPSEPILGGEIVDGLSLVASSKRWWQLQYVPSLPQRWIPVETPAGRGLGAPAHCTDGKFIYYVGKDGIYRMLPGLPADSLTDEDLSNLFPSDAIPLKPNILYAGKTAYAPDYQFGAQFRLAIMNSFLRFHYFDSTGTARTLTLDMRLDSAGKPRMAWSVDAFADPITNSYQPIQPSSTTAGTSTGYTPGYFADSNGNVWVEADLHNDNATPITGILAVPETDYGDGRVNKQWLDSWVDVLASAGATVQGVVGGTKSGASQSIAASSSRVQTISPLSGVLGSYLGLLLTWSDDFTKQSTWTQIYQWSAEAVGQPLLIRSWSSVPTSHGLKGYQHIPRIRFAYMTQDANPATLTITSYDGMSPAVVTLPGTSGAHVKTEFVLTANKGLLYTYSLSHPTGIAPDWESCEVLVGQWDRSGPYAEFQGLGGLANP